MTDVTNINFATFYPDWLTLGNDDNPGLGLTPEGTLKNVQDGNGINSPMQIATNAVNFSRTGGNTFKLDGDELTADAINLNSITSELPDFTFSTAAMRLPMGFTGQRPGIPEEGMFRYNQTTNKFEGYILGLGWKNFQMEP